MRAFFFRFCERRTQDLSFFFTPRQKRELARRWTSGEGEEAEEAAEKRESSRILRWTLANPDVCVSDTIDSCQQFGEAIMNDILPKGLDLLYEISFAWKNKSHQSNPFCGTFAPVTRIEVLISLPTWWTGN